MIVINCHEAILMNKQSAHKNEIISQFTQQAVPFTRLPGHLDALEKLVEMSKVHKSSRVLDVASGPGLVASAFSKVAQQVECIDLTPAMLEQAKQHTITEGLTNITFREGDAMALPYPDNSFDVVVTRYSFHHFLKPEGALREMIRVCGPGGRVVVADVAINPDCSEKFNHLEHLRDSSHVRALTLTEFNNFFMQDELVDSMQASYIVDVKLEEQLSVSFPKGDDANRIRELITEDIGNNKTGTNPRREQGEIYYSYPISIFSASKKA